MEFSYYYVAEEKVGLNFEDSPSRMPHKDIRDRVQTDPTREIYLMFATPGAPQSTPPGVKLLSILKPGQGARPPRAELLRQLESYSHLATNVLMASTDSIRLLGNRLTQRIRFLLCKCKDLAFLDLNSMEGPVKGRDILTATYQSFILYVDTNMQQEQFNENGEEEVEDENEEEEDVGNFEEPGAKADFEEGSAEVGDENEEEEDVGNFEEPGAKADFEEGSAEVAEDFAATLAGLVGMEDSMELVARLLSLLPLSGNEQDLVSFSHFLCLLAERDLLACEGAAMTPPMLRSRMREFFRSSFKKDRDESAHVFTWMFPLGYRSTNNFDTKELLLKTDCELHDSFIEARCGVIDHLNDTINGKSSLRLQFADLISISLSYIEGGVALLDRELSQRRLRQKAKNRRRRAKRQRQG